MNGKKEKALISNNPTFDLGFISKEFENQQTPGQQKHSITKIKKCLTQRKIIKSIDQVLPSSPKIRYLASKTQKVDQDRYDSLKLPQLSIGKAKQGSLGGLDSKLYDRSHSKNGFTNKMIRSQIDKALNVAESHKFAFRIKKYGNWNDC